MDPKILRTINYGMYAIGVVGDRYPSACIVNTLTQVTASPQTIALSLNQESYTNEMIKKHGIFSVSVLSEDTSGTVVGALGFNSGRETNKLKNVGHKVLREGVPVLRESICCWFLCRVTGSIETRTHTIFIAEVIAGSDEYKGTPMTYSYYHNTIKGRASENAPTFLIQNEDNYSLSEKYTCKICGYTYNNNNNKPFDQLEDDWACPVCRASKDAFVKN